MRIDVSKFINSSVRKMFWTKVIIVSDFNILYMIYKFESFWPNFEMMTPQYGVGISRFPENSFINEYLISKFLLLFIFFFLSPLVGEIQVWALFRANFGLMTSPRWVKTSKFWDRGFKNEYLTSNFPLLLTFIFLASLVREMQVWALFDSIMG